MITDLYQSFFCQHLNYTRQDISVLIKQCSDPEDAASLWTSSHIRGKYAMEWSRIWTLFPNYRDETSSWLQPQNSMVSVHAVVRAFGIRKEHISHKTSRQYKPSSSATHPALFLRSIVLSFRLLKIPWRTLNSAFHLPLPIICRSNTATRPHSQPPSRYSDRDSSGLLFASWPYNWGGEGTILGPESEGGPSIH